MSKNSNKYHYRNLIIEIDTDPIVIGEWEKINLKARVSGIDNSSLNSYWWASEGLRLSNTSTYSVDISADPVWQDREALINFQLLRINVNGGAESIAIKEVKVSIKDQGGCRDPGAVNYESWNSGCSYPDGSLVSHNYLIWEVDGWAGQEQEPGHHPAWLLKSETIADWRFC